MSCTKRAFASPQQAQQQLRKWRQHGRRSAFDTAHAYKADCVEHRGLFHVGHTHDTGAHRKPGLLPKHRTKDTWLYTLEDDLDTLFEQQVRRIDQTLTSVTARRQQRRLKHTDHDTYLGVRRDTRCLVEEEDFDVEIRKR